jgi:hypothetical protein
MPGAGGDVNTTLPLVLAIVGWFLCATHIFGIIAFIFALQAGTAKKMGDMEGARKKSKLSIILSIVGLGLNILCGGIYGIILAVSN